MKNHHLSKSQCLTNYDVTEDFVKKIPLDISKGQRRICYVDHQKIIKHSKGYVLIPPTPPHEAPNRYNKTWDYDFAIVLISPNQYQSIKTLD